MSTTAVRAYLTRISDSVRRAFSRRKPWSELADQNTLSRPTSFSDATSRIRTNFYYFRVNYVTVIASVLGIYLVSHPFSLLILLSLLAAWLFLYVLRPTDQPLVILNRTYSDRETLGVLIFLTVFVVFLTNVGSLVMCATLMGFAVVCLHGAFRDPEDLFLDEHDLPGSGLFSFIGGNAAASSSMGPTGIDQV